MNATAPQPDAPAYLATLGLQRAPFLDRIDDTFFYADPVLVQRLDLLQHLTQFGDMLLGVLGPGGSGKSTLLQQFMARGGSTWRCCRINAAQIEHPGELLAKLGACFAPDADADPERAKAALLRQLQSLRLASQLPVILVDDAQLLPDPVLKALLELGGNARETLKLVRIVLFAEPGLEQKLIQSGHHSPQQPLLHSLEVPSFDTQQSAAYLMYRLAVAGYSGDSPFSLTEIRALHKAAEGQPGKLNVLAHETLMERAGRLAARKKAAAPAASDSAGPGKARSRTGLAVFGGALVLAGAAYLLHSGWLQTRTPGQQEPVQIALPDMPPEIPRPGSDGDGDGDGDETIPKPAPESETGVDSGQETTPPPAMADASGLASDQAVAADREPQPQQQTELEPPNAASETGVITPVTSPAGTTEAPAIPTEPASADTGTAAPPAPQAAAEPPSAAPPVPETAPAPLAEVPAEAPAETPAVAPVQTSSAPAPEPAAAPPPARSTTAAPAAAFREDWLRERPAAHYALQLLGVRSEDSLRSYLAQHRPQGPVAYFRTEYKGGEWFVLVQGDYPSMAAARAAVSTLPAAIRKAKPWPRSFASVHADMEKAAASAP